MDCPDPITFLTEDGFDFQLSCSTSALTVRYDGPADHAIYIAWRDDLPGAITSLGSTIVPYGQGLEGSTVFLPFAADCLYFVSGDGKWKRSWDRQAWGDRHPDCPELSVKWDQSGQRTITLQRGSSNSSSVVVYAKDLTQNYGWGSLIGSCDSSTESGFGDKEIDTFFQINSADSNSCRIRSASRFSSDTRERIYELFVRLFGNTNSRRKCNGTLAENGCGKFADITPTAIKEIAAMGFTHIWLMGVIRHATTTSYDQLGLEFDKTDLMKGLAGSPYAIKDYFDVSPDLAIDPEKRLDEFKELVGRIRAEGLKVLVDLVANHVCRSYRSYQRPDQNLGMNDDRSLFFATHNNYFYLGASDDGGGPPLRLPTFDRTNSIPISPTCAVLCDCNGLFESEMTSGRVTGNNRITWTPSLYDWYETVKLNYGFDFAGKTSQQRYFPNANAPDLPVPDTWHKIDAVLEYWQQLGADGFRCDMAHMIPPEFWTWCIARCRQRNPAVFFMAEAYNDFSVVETTAPEVLALRQKTLFHGLLRAGFNAVYGHDLYRTIKGIYDASGWANDIDAVVKGDFVAQHSVHYSENHDEVRLASPYAWGAVGAAVGRAASAVLFGVSRGPILLYNGQEIGEPATEAEGFSGADGRTSIFDYWSCPELAKWVNDGRFDGGHLCEEQKRLRDFYSRLTKLCGTEVFSRGQFLALNPHNIDNPAYGRMPGETASGHWLYSFIRHDRKSNNSILAVTNFHSSRDLIDIYIRLPGNIDDLLRLGRARSIRLHELLADTSMTIHCDRLSDGIHIASIPALTAYYFQIEAIDS